MPPGAVEELEEARLFFKDCWIACDSQYCKEQCVIIYQNKLQAIYDKYS